MVSETTFVGQGKDKLVNLYKSCWLKVGEDKLSVIKLVKSADLADETSFRKNLHCSLNPAISEETSEMPELKWCVLCDSLSSKQNSSIKELT